MRPVFCLFHSLHTPELLRLSGNFAKNKIHEYKTDNERLPGLLIRAPESFALDNRDRLLI